MKNIKIFITSFWVIINLVGFNLTISAQQVVGRRVPIAGYAYGVKGEGNSHDILFSSPTLKIEALVNPEQPQTFLMPKLNAAEPAFATCICDHFNNPDYYPIALTRDDVRSKERGGTVMVTYFPIGYYRWVTAKCKVANGYRAWNDAPLWQIKLNYLYNKWGFYNIANGTTANYPNNGIAAGYFDDGMIFKNNVEFLIQVKINYIKADPYVYHWE